MSTLREYVVQDLDLPNPVERVWGDSPLGALRALLRENRSMCAGEPLHEGMGTVYCETCGRAWLVSERRA